jgi:hypothetical protein
MSGEELAKNWRRGGATIAAVVSHAQVESALFVRLRDLFSLQVDMVFYDLTSTYFEGRGPPEIGAHGHSRDGKPRNPQVLVGLVLVDGWPIAHHVFEGNRRDAKTVPDVLRDLEQRFGLKRQEGRKAAAAALGKRMNALRWPGRRGGVRRVAALQFGRSGLGADIVDPTRLTLSRQCARGPIACSCSTGGTLAVWQQPSPHISACASAGRL